MEIKFFYKNLDKKEEQSFAEYVEQKLPAIKNLLTKFSKDSLILKASIEKFEKHDAFSVELSLTLRNKNIHAKEASHHITKAVDDSRDRFVAQLKKTIELMREPRGHKSIRNEEVHVKVDELA